MGAAEPAAAARLWVALLAGVSGGVCNVLVGHPFDTIKVRAQAGRPLFQGSLLTGILGQLLGVSPMNRPEGYHGMRSLCVSVGRLRRLLAATSE